MSEFKKKLEEILLKKLDSYKDSDVTPSIEMLKVMVEFAKISTISPNPFDSLLKLGEMGLPPPLGDATNDEENSESRG